MVEDFAGAFFFPLVDFFEPGIEGFGGAGDGEDDVDELGVFGGVDGDVAGGEAVGEGGEAAELDGFGSALGE